MMENGFSSPRSDRFNPAGLRVLVVDDDPTWLKILEKMLKKCSYEVTTCGLARDALSLLRERKDGYDIVISDVNMPDMDGFKLLEHVGLEMDLPVIMMSVDGETSRVMKGVQHGACDYLLKPIRMKELRNIWQHVFRKKIHEVRDIENIEGAESIQISRGGSDLAEENLFFSGEDYNSMKKRKDSDIRHDDKDSADATSAKKARVVWSVDLHQKFVKAVDQIGYDKVGPKKILDLMNVPWLSRENVASHLQKYRLYLSRLQKENELKASVAGIKHTDSSSKDSAASFSFQNSANMQKSDLSNGTYGFSGCNSIIQNVSPKSLETEPKSMVAVPVVEPKRVLTVEIPNLRETRRSQMSFDGSFAPLESEANFATSDSIVPKQYSWCEAPAGQFNNENKALQLDNGFRQLPLQADHIQPAPSIISGPSLTEKDVKVESLYTNYNSKHANNPSPSGSVTMPFSVPTRADTVSHQAFEPISAAMCNVSDLVSAQTNINYVSGSSFPLVDENLRFSWSQGDLFPTNLGIQGIGFSDYDDPGLIPDIPFHLYDTLKFDYDHISDPTEYAVIDQGLFIA